jgi:glycosyltransferase involved in cell wall biosynthesis/organic radical activating enzyme
MKWIKRGHQLDELGERYLKVKNLYIYGIDDRAKKIYDLLRWLDVADEFNISFVLDITVWNKESQHMFCGKRVIAFQTDLCAEVSRAPEENVIALPAASQTNETAILKGLNVHNIFHIIEAYNRNDNFIQNYLCVWLMYKHGILLSHWTNFMTTTRCTCNCKACLNSNNYVIDPKDVSFEDFKSHIDVVFSKFDYLYNFHFSGGEPLLVKELPQYIRYIEDNYKGRIFEFLCLTNGTLIPDNELLEAMEAMNVELHIADYSSSITYSKIEEINEVCNKNNIHVQINKSPYWVDLDYVNTDNSAMSDEALEKYKDECNSFLQDIGDKRIYACCWASFANRAGIGEINTNDYIEIAVSSKMEILEYRQGYTCNGYVELCKHCQSFNCEKHISPAIQLPRRYKVKEREQTKSDAATKYPVSVCVPIFNSEKYLTRCVDSILAQTYENIEIVLVNDGSTDNCGLICDEYARVDPRVVVVHKKNQGEASARNAGLRAARGDYVMFIDSDDEYLPNAVELMIDAAKSNNVDLVMGGYLERRNQIEHFATGHVRRYTAREAAQSYLYPDCSYGITYIISTVNAKLFRREIINKNNILFDERFVIGNDLIFICDYLSHADTIYDVFAPIYVYYKFDPSERIQGMAWFYPDSFFLFAYAADRMIKIAQPDENEYKELIIKQYKDLLYALTNATLNQAHLKNGLMPYLTSFCNEIDLLQIGAKIDLTENYIKKEEGALPFRLISYLIANKRFDELYKMLAALGKARKMISYKGGHVRQMIQLGQEDKEEQDETGVNKSPTVNVPLATEQFRFLNDTFLAEHLDELVTTIAASRRQMDVYEEKLALYEAESEAQKSAIDEYKTEIGVYQAELAALNSAIGKYEAKFAEYEAETGALKAELNADKAEIEIQKSTIDTYEARAGDYEMQLDAQKAVIKEYEDKIYYCQMEVNSYIQSNSWRITAPLRAIMGYLKK